MTRAIVHMDLDTFFVSCERLTNSELNGMPLIVGGGTRGVVTSCSYETRKFGVRSAISMKMALRYALEICNLFVRLFCVENYFVIMWFFVTVLSFTLLLLRQ